MLIFIPMSGFGDRYIRAGYTQPKPLIPVDGVPMIERIVTDFPGPHRFLFAINRTHSETTPIVSELKRIRPDAKVVVIDPHKDGPARTVLDCAEHLPDEEDVLLNYCDFGVDWDFGDFLRWLPEGRWDGAMTAYRGFHPHSLGPTLYAYMRNSGDQVLEIREKHHFTPNKFDEYASSGLYYFRRGSELKRTCREIIASGQRVANEFYISMAIQRLIESGGKVGVYPLRHFYQWGTPDDLRDYEGWARGMRSLDTFLPKLAKAPTRSALVVPMAGRGQRFVDQGYKDPKPLIDVCGRPMIAQALACLPRPTRTLLIAQAEHARDARFQEAVARLEPAGEVSELTAMTEGQACTAEIGVKQLDPNSPVLIAPCDTGYVYDVDRWQQLEQAADADLIVWSAKGHLPALWRPQMYGWMHVAGDQVRAVAVKKQVEGVPAAEQQVVTGTFWFKEARTFLAETAAMLADNDRVNNEFYVDTLVRRMLARGYKVRAFTVDKYMPWGTPEELKTFFYWNEVFRQGARL